MGLTERRGRTFIRCFAPTITAQVFYAGSISKQSAAGPYYPVEFSPGSASPPYRGGLLPSPSGQATYSLPSLNTSPYTSNQSSSLLEEKVTAFLGGGVLRFAALQNNTFNSSDPGSSFPNGEYRLWGTADLGSKSPGVTTAYDGTLSNLTFPGGYRAINLWSNNRDLLKLCATGWIELERRSVIHGTCTAILSRKRLFGARGIDRVLWPKLRSFRNHGRDSLSHQHTSVGQTFARIIMVFRTGFLPLADLRNKRVVRFSLCVQRPTLWSGLGSGRDIAVRASAGGGYALPALFNLIGGPIQNEGTYYDQTVQNPNLKPEKEFGFDVGTDVRFKFTDSFIRHLSYKLVRSVLLFEYSLVV